MKTLFSTLILITIISVSSSAQKVEKIWESDTVLNVPESVLFADSVLYVSNVNGKPLEKNSKGYISKMSLNGDVIKKEWATGLNAPKGMGSFGEFIFVSDIDKVLVIDINTGTVVNTFEFKAAKFLNDITISPKGNVYVSDLHDNAIYIIQEDFSKVFIKDARLSWVNGLHWEQDYLLAGTSEGVFKVDKSGKIVSHYIKDTGGIDGLERITDKQLIITDWAGKVQAISPNDDLVLLLNFESEKYNAADLGINKKQRIIYIPTFFGNTVAAFKVIY